MPTASSPNSVERKQVAILRKFCGSRSMSDRASFGVETLIETHHVDHHALVRAVADLLDLVASTDLEFDAAAIDFGHFRVCNNPAADRSCRQMPHVDKR